MDASAAAAAAAHRRVKRAMGLLRRAAALLAPDLDDVDVVAEIHLEHANRGELDAILDVELERRRELDVVILARPRAPSAPVGELGGELVDAGASPFAVPQGTP